MPARLGGEAATPGPAAGKAPSAAIAEMDSNVLTALSTRSFLFPLRRSGVDLSGAFIISLATRPNFRKPGTVRSVKRVRFKDLRWIAARGM